MAAIVEVERPLAPILPAVDRLLGPAKPVADVLAALDEQYKKEGKPEIYFLADDEPISPHIETLLGPSKLAIDADKTIAEQLDALLGEAKPVEDVLKSLDEQYRKDGKSDIWFLPLSEPISPHLDELLGPVTQETDGDE